jgi:uncharacterized membrane protein YgcG
MQILQDCTDVLAKSIRDVLIPSSLEHLNLDVVSSVPLDDAERKHQTDFLKKIARIIQFILRQIVGENFPTTDLSSFEDVRTTTVGVDFAPIGLTDNGAMVLVLFFQAMTFLTKLPRGGKVHFFRGLSRDRNSPATSLIGCIDPNAKIMAAVGAVRECVRTQSPSVVETNGHFHVYIPPTPESMHPGAVGLPCIRTTGPLPDAVRVVLQTAVKLFLSTLTTRQEIKNFFSETILKRSTLKDPWIQNLVIVSMMFASTQIDSLNPNCRMPIIHTLIQSVTHRLSFERGERMLESKETQGFNSRSVPAQETFRKFAATRILAIRVCEKFGLRDAARQSNPREVLVYVRSGNANAADDADGSSRSGSSRSGSSQSGSSGSGSSGSGSSDSSDDSDSDYAPSDDDSRPAAAAAAAAGNGARVQQLIATEVGPRQESSVTFATVCAELFAEILKTASAAIDANLARTGKTTLTREEIQQILDKEIDLSEYEYTLEPEFQAEVHAAQRDAVRGQVLQIADDVMQEETENGHAAAAQDAAAEQLQMSDDEMSDDE